MRSFAVVDLRVRTVNLTLPESAAFGRGRWGGTVFLLRNVSVGLGAATS